MSSVQTDIDRPENAFQAAADMIRAGEWTKGLEAADAVAATGAEPDGAVRLLLAIALVRSDAWQVASITPDLIRGGEANDVRRLVLSPLIQKNALNDATQLLGALIDACPPGHRDRTQRASLNARLGRWDAAIADVDLVAASDPDDKAVQAARFQYRIQGGKVRDAAELARTIPHLPSDGRTLNLMLL
ncbi:hypothetical protein, partial [Sphingomonas sp.]|uniref:hypothetical protein n=1 Tax=Sphingomonas sp. TaxID=28214 RepID=UPI0025D06524